MSPWLQLAGGGVLLYLGAEWFVGGALPTQGSKQTQAVGVCKVRLSKASSSSLSRGRT